MGAGGVFVIAFLDSSVLTFPFVTDALVMELSIEKPARMAYYAGMAALGSLLGCIWLYLLARKGGEAYFRRRHGGGAERVRRWVEQNAFLSVFVPGILPPPFPFKIFVLAEGVFQVPLKTFVLALLSGRALRYFAEGILAIRYGAAMLALLKDHTWWFVLGVAVVLALLYLVKRFIFRSPARGSR